MGAAAGPEGLRVASPIDWLDTSVLVPPQRRVLIAIAAVAISTDLAVKAGGVGLGGTLLIIFMAGGILASGILADRQARLLVACAPLFGVWLLFRTSPWLLLPDLSAVAGLFVLGVSLPKGRLLDLTLPATAARATQVLAHGLAAPGYMLDAARSISPPVDPARRARTRALARGVLIAAPLLAVLGLLLASADPVFASLIQINTDPAAVLSHLVLLGVGAWAMGGLLRAASGSQIQQLPEPPRLGGAEAATILGLVNALFVAFAIAQLVALSEGGRKVIETAGLTYAEYARSGFFQLLAVAAINLAVVLTLKAVVDQTDRAVRRRFALLAEITVALTLIIVFVAVRRLGLYADVFGFTMLRLYCTLFAYWLGAVFVLLGLVLLGLGRGRSWLPSAAVGVGLAGLMWLNAANPEAIVVRHNVTFADRTGRFDSAYLFDLSDDAIPALVESLPDLSPPDRRLVLGLLCPPRSLARTSWPSYNVARSAAFESLAAACTSSPSG